MTDRLKLLAGITAASRVVLSAPRALPWSRRASTGANCGRPIRTRAWLSCRPPRLRASPKGETLSHDLEGRQVALTGYLLPVDREDDLVYEFLLLPVVGLCSHLPPPPPNQAVHVSPAKPYRSG